MRIPCIDIRKNKKIYLFSNINCSILVNKVNFDELKKLYYTIGEVAEMFDVNTSLIRFWEKEFKQIKPKKNSKGNRLFTVKDIQTFSSIYQLVKVEGFTLEGAKKMLKSGNSIPINDSSNEEVSVQPKFDQSTVIERLEKIKAKLLSLKS